MSSLLKLYNSKEAGIKVNKTFMVPPTELYVEEGFNLREVSEEHINDLMASYRAGESLPPLVVKVTDLGIKVIDGHHRREAAIRAGVLRVECKQHEGDEASAIVTMIKTTQGRPLTPIERAKGYLRLKNQGHTPDEIAKMLNRSRPDIDNHLVLINAPEEVIQAVKNKEVGFSTAVTEVRKSGVNSGVVITEAVAKAKAEGKKKVTKDSISNFTKSDFVTVMELLSLLPQTEVPESIRPLLNKYIGVR